MTENPFGRKLLGISMRRDFGVLKGLRCLVVMEKFDARQDRWVGYRQVEKDA